MILIPTVESKKGFRLDVFKLFGEESTGWKKRAARCPSGLTGIFVSNVSSQLILFAIKGAKPLGEVYATYTKKSLRFTITSCQSLEGPSILFINPQRESSSATKLSSSLLQQQQSTSNCKHGVVSLARSTHDSRHVIHIRRRSSPRRSQQRCCWSSIHQHSTRRHRCCHWQ